MPWHATVSKGWGGPIRGAPTRVYPGSQRYSVLGRRPFRGLGESLILVHVLLIHIAGEGNMIGLDVADGKARRDRGRRVLDHADGGRLDRRLRRCDRRFRRCYCALLLLARLRDD